MHCKADIKVRFIFISFGCQCAGNWEIRKYYTRFWLVNAHLNANTHTQREKETHINSQLQFMCVRAWVLYALFAVDNISHIFYDIRFDFMKLLLCRFFRCCSFSFFFAILYLFFPPSICGNPVLMPVGYASSNWLYCVCSEIGNTVIKK